MGKKRKGDELEADSDLYQKFAKAATAERQFRWLQRDHGGATILPMAVLINYLHEELNGQTRLVKIVDPETPKNVDNLDTADLPHIGQSVGRGYEGRHGYKTPCKRYSGAHVHHQRKDGYDSSDAKSPKKL